MKGTMSDVKSKESSLEGRDPHESVREEPGGAPEGAASGSAESSHSAPQADSPSLEELQAKLAEAEDRALRAQAELENVRRRLRREMEDERRYYSMPLIKDLLSVLDNLHRAIEAAETTGGSEGLLEGVRMVADQLEETLKTHHCIPIEAAGLPFDPNVHEAIAEHPHEELPPGTVAHVARRGFKLHDRVVRPSQVIVTKRAEGSEESNEAAREEPSDQSTSR